MYNQRAAGATTETRAGRNHEMDWTDFAGLLTNSLLTNPGAETGGLTGWSIGGGTGPSVDNGTFDRGINPYDGSYDFYGALAMVTR
jgi:hypothetical protein